MIRKSSGEILAKLRKVMSDVQHTTVEIAAYLVPSNDAHNSLCTADCDKRLAYISGFKGEQSTAVVTQKHACIWVFGEHFSLASRQVDKNWTIMRKDFPGTPNLQEWLTDVLPSGSNVGVDPTLMSYNRWKLLENRIRLANLSLVPIETNLVDVIWTNRPRKSENIIQPQSNIMAGKKIKEKILEVRRLMKRRKASLLFVSALDEIAWILNLRGSDIRHTPFFFAYLLIEEKSFVLFIDGVKITEEIRKHLLDEARVKFYIELFENVYGNLNQKSIMTDGLVWCPGETNYSMVKNVPPAKLLIRPSPIALKKTVKNPSEIFGMMQSNLRDSVAMTCTFHWLESNVKRQKVTEVDAANKLEEFRNMQPHYVETAFDTISAYGKNSAEYYYVRDVNANIAIEDKELYLLDAGGQYRDGTTDMCRSWHFGEPTKQEKELFTRVLKGGISVSRAVFPIRTRGTAIDTYARKFLWEIGLDYKQPTGHGIGCFLDVHEGPISIGKTQLANDPGLSQGMCVTNEPGYFGDKFGVRFNNVLLIVICETQNEFDSIFLTFDTITFVPIPKNLIEFSMLTFGEKQWLNTYHMKCKNKLCPILKKMGRKDVADWVRNLTEPLSN